MPWAVLTDPEGNEFCVLEPRDIYRDTGPVAAILTDCADPAALARFWADAAGWPSGAPRTTSSGCVARGNRALPGVPARPGPEVGQEPIASGRGPVPR